MPLPHQTVLSWTGPYGLLALGYLLMHLCRKKNLPEFNKRTTRSKYQSLMSFDAFCYSVVILVSHRQCFAVAVKTKQFQKRVRMETKKFFSFLSFFVLFSCCLFIYLFFVRTSFYMSRSTWVNKDQRKLNTNIKVLVNSINVIADRAKPGRTFYRVLHISPAPWGELSYHGSQVKWHYNPLWKKWTFKPVI